MDAVFPGFSVFDLLLATAVAAFAGLVKGVVGFAMPMIFISGLSTVMAPELALAGLILPTLVTNGMQSLRQGMPAALASMRRFRRLLLIGGVVLLASSQLVTVLPPDLLLAAIGVSVGVFATLQLAGWSPRLAAPAPRVEAAVATVAGFVGGLSGVWGPPLVAYLTALGTEKREQIRVQGVVYGLGAAALTIAHLISGVLNATSVRLSLWLVVPAVVGMWLGGLLQDRIDQKMFRRATLVVLLLAAANLVRRALV